LQQAFSGKKVNGQSQLVKLCLNGHEWAKRQLEKRKIAYEAGLKNVTKPIRGASVLSLTSSRWGLGGGMPNGGWCLV
jgi:hypothetical protein